MPCGERSLFRGCLEKGNKMFDKLKAVESRFEEINARLLEPDVVSDNAVYRSLMKEYRNLEPIVEKFREYQRLETSFQEACELLEQGGLDPDFKQVVEEEYRETKQGLERCSEELKILLLPKDPNDDKSVIVEIRGGAGGEEAALFANSLFRMYSMYADKNGWKVEVLNANPTELGGYKEISFSIEGESVYSKLKFESGVHRVQRVPETEAAGRIHTSTVTVAVLPEAEEVELEINPGDLQIDTYRASGAGGQPVSYTHLVQSP